MIAIQTMCIFLAVILAVLLAFISAFLGARYGVNVAMRHFNRYLNRLGRILDTTNKRLMGAVFGSGNRNANADGTKGGEE